MEVLVLVVGVMLWMINVVTDVVIVMAKSDEAVVMVTAMVMKSDHNEKHLRQCL